MFGRKRKPNFQELFDDALLELLRSIANQTQSNLETQRESNSAQNALDTMWRKIMILCHPDRHENSELSQEVTRWLIAHKPKERSKNEKT